MRQHNGGLSKICTCPRKRWPKCRHSWHFNFKWDDHHYRFSLDRHLGRHVDSKSEAEAEAEKIRREIREGRFGRPAPSAAMTLRQLSTRWVDDYVKVERAKSLQAFVYALNTICRTEIPHHTGKKYPLGEWSVADIVTGVVTRFRKVRRTQTGETGTNRNLQTLRALFNWGIGQGYITKTPFRREHKSVVTIPKAYARTRRLEDGEDAALLTACPPPLRAVVECALATGMRRAEIANLTWRMIDGIRVQGSDITWSPNATIVLPGRKTKSGKSRSIPISTRLRHILEMRRFDPAGNPIPLDGYCFGDEIGQRVESCRRSWYAAVLRAHGHQPVYTKTSNLSAESRAILKKIDLHFHDLRRECGSRWLEGGVDIHIVRDWLGHWNVSQTSDYLSGTVQGQHDAMRGVRAGEGCLMAAPS